MVYILPANTEFKIQEKILNKLQHFFQKLETSYKSKMAATSLVW